MVEITDPSSYFKETPKKFSGYSQVVGIEKQDYRSGIILENLEEVKTAIVVYGGGLVDKADATQMDLQNEVGKSHGAEGLALLFMASRGKSGFADKLAEIAVTELSKKDTFRRSFDYDAMGTNFFKTSVSVDKVDDKYVLGMCAAYVGDEPEEDLAKVLKKTRALMRSEAKAKLSIVDDWWFNADLKSLLNPLKEVSTISDDDIKASIEKIVDSYRFYERPEIKLPYEGKFFDLSIGLDAYKFLRPKVGGEYLESRGTAIVGPSWTIFTDDGKDYAPARPKEFSLTLSVSPSDPKSRYSSNPIVNYKDMELTQKARDFVAEKIKVK
jgi:hypothetical protein